MLLMMSVACGQQALCGKCFIGIAMARINNEMDGWGRQKKRKHKEERTAASTQNINWL
jgi:hypothetical protein